MEIRADAAVVPESEPGRQGTLPGMFDSNEGHAGRRKENADDETVGRHASRKKGTGGRGDSQAAREWASAVYLGG